MSLHWTVDHDHQVVTAVLSVSTTVDDLYSFLGAVITDGAMGYAKIFDATEGTQWITAPKLEPFTATARLYSTMKFGSVGPLAIVVADSPGQTRAAEYVETSGVNRPVRIFANRDEAAAWIVSFRQKSAEKGK